MWDLICTCMNSLEIWRKERALINTHNRAIQTDLGKLYKYPECCIKQFCDEVEAGMLPAVRREYTHNHPLPPISSEQGYVPCDECMKKYI